MLIKKLLVCMAFVPMIVCAMDPAPGRKRRASQDLVDSRQAKKSRHSNPLEECICDPHRFNSLGHLTPTNRARFQELVLEHEAFIKELSPAAHAALPDYLFTLLKASDASAQVIDVLACNGINLADMRNDAGQTLLHQAVGYGRNPKIIEILSGHVPVNHADEDGATALHLAAQGYNPKSREVVGALLEAGADPNIQNEDGDTPLHKALNSYNEDVAHMLICEPGVKRNIRNRDLVNPERPIDIAVAKACIGSLRLLLARPDVDDSGLNAETVEHDVPGIDFAEVTLLLQPETRKALRIEYGMRRIAPEASSIASAVLARRLGSSRKR